MSGDGNGESHPVVSSLLVGDLVVTNAKVADLMVTEAVIEKLVARTVRFGGPPPAA